MKVTPRAVGLTLALALSPCAALKSKAQAYSQNFNSNSVFTDTYIINNSTNNTTTNSPGNSWGLAPSIVNSNGTVAVLPYEGNQFIQANFLSISTGTGTISNWLIMPEFKTLQNGDTFTFYTTTKPNNFYPDRLQFRLSLNGASTSVGATPTSVGDFSNQLLEINPLQLASPLGYPENWTQYTITLSGLDGVSDGRVAFRYYVTGAGPDGANSNVIGLDAFTYTPVPEPSPSAVLALGTLVLMCGGALRRMQSKAESK